MCRCRSTIYKVTNKGSAEVIKKSKICILVNSSHSFQALPVDCSESTSLVFPGSSAQASYDLAKNMQIDWARSSAVLTLIIVGTVAVKKLLYYLAFLHHVVANYIL